jgi:hypothetical protein
VFRRIGELLAINTPLPVAKTDGRCLAR